MTRQRIYLPIIGRLIILIRLVIKGSNKNIDFKYDKTPLWKRELTRWQIFKINSRVAWRRFDTQTRGMGLIFIMLIVVTAVINTFTLVGVMIADYFDNIKYKSALESACLDETFYAWNFKSCENINIRPIGENNN